MVTEKIRTIANTAAFAAGITARRSLYGSFGQQVSVFVKGILDKYTGILNYQFDYAALVFLEQTAQGATEGMPGQTNGQMVLVSCRLLAFLARNITQENLFSDPSAFLTQQVLGMVEQNLRELQNVPLEVGSLKQSVPSMEAASPKQSVSSMEAASPKQSVSFMEAGSQLRQCYVEYRELAMLKLSVDRQALTKKVYQLQERIWRVIRMQEQKMAVFGEVNVRMKTKTYQAPFVMSPSFFRNLYHCMKENRIPGYRQIWIYANRRQAREYWLRYGMRQFMRERDFLKQEEQLADIVRWFGKEDLLEYLARADLQVYQKILPVLEVLSDRGAGWKGPLLWYPRRKVTGKRLETGKKARGEFRLQTKSRRFRRMGYWQGTGL